jgi:glutaredoxin 3
MGRIALREHENLANCRSPMPKVTIYTKPYCPYCIRAVSLLEKKGADFIEIEAASDPEVRQEMMQRSGRTTFPQIFVGEQHIGGCDDMMALEYAGKLDPLLRAA